MSYLGNNKMTFLNELGKGAYARVIKARVDDKNGTEMALKIQKPACTWEWYISKEIQQRLKDSEKASKFYIFNCIYCNSARQALFIKFKLNL